MPDESRSTLEEALRQRHPVYAESCAYWQFYADHYLGGPSYALKPNPLPQPSGDSVKEAGRTSIRSYIYKYSLERAEDYADRVNRTPYVNFVAPVVDQFAAIVGKQENVIIDTAGDAELDTFLDDCDRRGSSFLQFMKDARTHAAVRGHTFLLVDSTRPQSEVVTKADERRQGIRSYLTEILPEDMLNWRLDDDGRPTAILYRCKREVESELLAAKSSDGIVLEYRYWDRAGWRVFREVDGGVVEMPELGGAHNLESIPLVVLYHRYQSDWLGRSMLTDSAKLAHMATNWVSSFDEAMLKQMFAQLVIRSRKEPKDVGVGISVYLHLNPDDNEEAAWIAPPTAPFAEGWAAFYKIVAFAYQAMGMKQAGGVISETTGTQEQSGISKAWDFSEAEKIMSAMALNEQEAAKQLFQFHARWYGRDFDGSVEYATKYDLSDLSLDLDNLVKFQSAGAPIGIRMELMKRAARKALPSLDEKTRDALDREIDGMREMDEERRAMEQEQHEASLAKAAPPGQQQNTV